MNGNFFFNSVPERLYRLAFYCSPCLHFNFTEVVGDKLFHSDYQPRHSAAGQPASSARQPANPAYPGAPQASRLIHIRHRRCVDLDVRAAEGQTQEKRAE